jgi:hypothetical protein
MQSIIKQQECSTGLMPLLKKRHDVFCEPLMIPCVIEQYVRMSPISITRSFEVTLLGKIFTRAASRVLRKSAQSFGGSDFISRTAASRTTLELAASVNMLLSGSLGVDKEAAFYHTTGASSIMKLRCGRLKLNTVFIFKLVKKGLRRLKSRWMRKGIYK